MGSFIRLKLSLLQLNTVIRNGTYLNFGFIEIFRKTLHNLQLPQIWKLPEKDVGMKMMEGSNDFCRKMQRHSCASLTSPLKPCTDPKCLAGEFALPCCSWNQHNDSQHTVCDGFQATQVHVIISKNSPYRCRRNQHILSNTGAKSVHVSVISSFWWLRS